MQKRHQRVEKYLKGTPFENSDVAASSRHCQGCLSPSTAKKLQQCTGCHTAWYCSKECQKKDWKEGKHKMLCARLKAMEPSKKQVYNDLESWMRRNHPILAECARQTLLPHEGYLPNGHIMGTHYFFVEVSDIGNGNFKVVDASVQKFPPRLVEQVRRDYEGQVHQAEITMGQPCAGIMVTRIYCGGEAQVSLDNGEVVPVARLEYVKDTEGNDDWLNWLKRTAIAPRGFKILVGDPIELD